MRTLVILNPYARRGSGGRRVDEASKALRDAGVQFQLVQTTGAGDAERLAAKAVQDGYDRIISAGGDGTLSEVVNGLLRATNGGPTPPLGVLPIGAGNDFADMLGGSRDLRVAAAAIARGITRPIDAASVNDRYFDNNCALGMEASVTLESSRIKSLSGNLRYVVALLRALRKLETWRLNVMWDGGCFDGPAHMLSICNGPRCGGLFKMAPDARFDDGLLDFVIAPAMSRSSVMLLTPRIVTGGHVRDPRIHYVRARELRVEIEPGAPVHADGEIIAAAATSLHVRCLPGAIQLLV